MMSRPLRVLHIIGGLQCGGAEALLYRLATRRSQIHHEIIALSSPDWYTPLLERSGIAVRHLNARSLASAPRAFPKLIEHIRRSRADVVQSWMYKSNILAGLVARRERIPVVWGIHTSSFEGIGLASRVAARIGGRWAPQLADFVINCSSRSAEMHSEFGYSKVNNAVIPNGYDPAVFFPDEKARISARSELGVEDGSFLAGTVARWNPQKDIPNLISAIEIGRAQGSPLRYMLAGRNLDERNLELVAALERARCRDFVILLGERPDVHNLYRAMDLHVLPSCGGEAFPNVVAESMLSGAPNVVTDVGDAAVIVGGTGWVVAPRDPQSLASAIGEAFGEYRSRPKAWQDRRAAARAHVADRFTLDRMAAAYEEIWRRAADHTLGDLAR